ncbi:MAG: hypothetical protein PHV42_04405 [Candidatus Pacebacteria bacterium]|nr:hypothetical protein [Candidatus Paceibacterota bacterium]
MNFKCECGRSKKRTKAMCNACYVEEKAFNKGNTKRLMERLLTADRSKFTYDLLSFKDTGLLMRGSKTA